jgi:hypothetical protein
VHIKRDGHALIMTESLVCSNYSDFSHIGNEFEKVDIHTYQCKICKEIIEIQSIQVVLDDKGKLKMKATVLI